MRISDWSSDVCSSDLNWLLSRGDQFDKGSHLNRIYSAMVGNGSTPEGVIQTLKEFPDLLNFLSLFLLAPGFVWIDNEFRSALGRRFYLFAFFPYAAFSAILGRRSISLRRFIFSSFSFFPFFLFYFLVLFFFSFFF